MRGRPPTPANDRFWKKVDKNGPILRPDLGRCWEWTASRIWSGYGQFRDGSSKMTGAHRFAYEQTQGPLPEGAMVLHRCDNPPCVNPTHLFLGDNSVNMLDASEKGRLNPRRGAASPLARLTEEKVQMIRTLLASGARSKDVAEVFHVHPVTVSRIKSGETWS